MPEINRDKCTGKPAGPSSVSDRKKEGGRGYLGGREGFHRAMEIRGVGAVHSLSGEEEEVSLSSVVLTIELFCVQEGTGWRSCLPTPWEGGGGSRGRGAR
jgi:hypothetical protein